MPSIGYKIRPAIPPLQRWRESVVGAPISLSGPLVDPVADAARALQSTSKYTFTWNDVDMVMGALRVMYHPPAAAIADQWTLVPMNWDAHLWHIGEKIASLLPPREEPPNEALGYGVSQQLAAYPIDNEGQPLRPGPDRAAASAIRNCLLGGIEADLHEGKAGHPTQLTLFTLEGILRAITRARTKGICHPPGVVFNAYRRWYRTRFQPLEPGKLGTLDGWLAFEPAMHEKVRVGPSTWSALKADASGEPWTPWHGSKGVDAVARSGPAGFFLEDPFALGAEIAALTHGSADAQHAAGAFAVIIHHRVRGRPVEFSVRQAVLRLDAVGNREMAVRLCDAFLWGRQLPDAAPVAEHFKYPQSAADALCLAVLASAAATEGRELAGEAWGGEDSGRRYNPMNMRSLRSMVGQILGATLLPDSLLCADLTRIVDRLAADVETEFRDDEEWWRSYPGW